MTYQIQNDFKGNPCAICKTNEDGSGMSIPIVADNTDYQAYLKWVAEGNTPLPAENT
jgi:hypothetical protein